MATKIMPRSLVLSPIISGHPSPGAQHSPLSGAIPSPPVDVSLAQSTRFSPVQLTPKPPPKKPPVTFQPLSNVQLEQVTRPGIQFEESPGLSSIRSPVDQQGILSRTRSDINQLQVQQDSSEIQAEDEFLNLSKDEITEEQELVSPMQRVKSQSEVATDEETGFWSETESSEDEVLGIRETGEEQFFRAGVLARRREATIETVRRDISDVQENLEFLNVKTTIRLNELKQIISKQEKRMSSLRSALKIATAKEMNQILAAGWSRKGDLGFVDLESILRPIISNRDGYPSADFVPISGLATDRIRRRSAKPPLLISPRVPYIRDRFITCPCSSTYTEPSDLRQMEDDHEKSTTTSDGIEDNDNRSALIYQFYRIMPKKSCSRKAINTFVRITQENETGELMEQINVDSGIVGSQDWEKKDETSSVSSEDKEKIKRTIESINEPRFCGIAVEEVMSRIMNVESTKAYKRMVEKKLYKYYRNNKRFRRSCVGVLPGGLSLVSRSKPPEPKYPPEGLLKEVSSLSSEGILSDILNELEGEAESEEDNFVALFEREEKEIVEAAAAVGFSTDADVVLSPGAKGRQKKTMSADLFTTTFQIGVPNREPTVLIELHRNEMIHHGSKECHLETEDQRDAWIKVCPEFCEKLDMCGSRVERLEDLSRCLSEELKPAEVTEYWQFSHDQGEPLWIYRGRSIKYLDGNKK